MNRALHTDELPFPALVETVSRLLKPNGQWWVLLPPYETRLLLEKAATVNLTPFHQLHLRHNDHKPAFRIVTGFAYGRQMTESDTLAIYEPNSNEHTPALWALLRDFYLLF